MHLTAHDLCALPTSPFSLQFIKAGYYYYDGDIITITITINIMIIHVNVEYHDSN